MLTAANVLQPGKHGLVRSGQTTAGKTAKYLQIIGITRRIRKIYNTPPSSFTAEVRSFESHRLHFWNIGFCRKNLGPRMSPRLLAAFLCSNATMTRTLRRTVSCSVFHKSGCSHIRQGPLQSERQSHDEPQTLLHRCARVNNACRPTVHRLGAVRYMRQEEPRQTVAWDVCCGGRSVIPALLQTVQIQTS